MMNRTELSLEAAEMICGGKTATMDEIEKKCGDNKFELQLVKVFEKVHNVLKDFGIKHEFKIFDYTIKDWHRTKNKNRITPFGASNKAFPINKKKKEKEIINMMNRAELNLETAEMICGGRKATIDEIKKKCGNNKFELQVVDMCDKIHHLLDDLGIKHDYKLEID